MTLRDYLNIIRERVAIIVATVIVVTSVALFFSSRQIPQYEATSRLRVLPIGAGTVAKGEIDKAFQMQTSMATEAEIVRSQPIAQEVIERLGLHNTPEQLLDLVKVENPQATEILKITATSVDRTVAKQVADEFAKLYIETRRERAFESAQRYAKSLKTQLVETQKKIDEIDAKMARISRGDPQYDIFNQDRYSLILDLTTYRNTYLKIADDQSLLSGGGEIIQEAPLPAEASSPNHVRNGILGFLVSLPLAVGLTLLRDSLSDTVKSKEEAERLTGADTLALIPLDTEWKRPSESYLASMEEPSSLVAESYRTLRVNLEFARKERKVRFVAITSPGRGEGKTATVANLGVAFAEAGRRTVAVSADVRAPRLHSFLGIDPSPGLTDALVGDTRGTSHLHPVSPNLWVCPTGTPDERAELAMGRRDMEGLFGRLGSIARSTTSAVRRTATRSTTSSRAGANRPTLTGSRTSDIVLFDTPPILRAAEASDLASSVDGVILVLHAGVTRRVAAQRAAEQIRKVGGRILGIALVGVRADEGFDPNDLEGGRADGNIVNRAWERVLEGLRR